MKTEWRKKKEIGTETRNAPATTVDDLENFDETPTMLHHFP